MSSFLFEVEIGLLIFIYRVFPKYATFFDVISYTSISISLANMLRSIVTVSYETVQTLSAHRGSHFVILFRNNLYA